MSDRQQLADQATQLVLAGLAIGGVAVSSSIAPTLVPVAVLAALGVDLLDKSEKKAVKKAIGSALETLASYQDFTDQDIATAKYILQDSQSQLMIDPQELASASSRQDLAERMLRPLFDSSSISREGAVGTVLQLVMGAVFDTLRQMDPFRQTLSYEQLRYLVGQSGVIESHLKGIKQSVDNTRAGVNDLLKAASRNRQPPFAPMPESKTINHYAARRFGVVGREEEQKTLAHFLEGGAGFQWLQIAGVGGQGKSRLALELLRNAQADGWTAGYMERVELEEFVDDWRNWLPAYSTLIVVDYLIGLEKLLAPLLHRLSRRSHELTVPVRVVLIERQRWDRGGLQAFKGGEQDASALSVSAAEGRAEWFLKIAERHDGNDVALMTKCFDEGVIELERLTPDDLVSIVRQVAEVDGMAPDFDDETIAGHLARIDESGRPLYAYFLGQALGEGRAIGAWEKYELLDDVLQREHSRRWKIALPGSPSAIGDDVLSMRLALLATMVGPIDCRHMASLIDWPQANSLTRREALVLTDGPLSEGMSGPSQLVPALQPDLLGEWFVLRAIEEGARVDILMEAAGSLSPESLSAFLARVAQDFPDHVSFDKLMECESTADEVQKALAQVAPSILVSLWKTERSLPESLMISLQLAASSGNRRAMNNLGSCYYKGKGVDQDLELAALWYRKGAEAGHGGAMNNLGVCYREGEGVDQDWGLAVEWFRKGAEAGHDAAMTNLGGCYEHGEGVDQNSTRAFGWFQKGAAAGGSAAMSFLGGCYEHGEGVDQDRESAEKWYRKGAAAGSDVAERNLARLLGTDSD